MHGLMKQGAVALLLVTATGCGLHSRAGRVEEQSTYVITADQVAQIGGRDAWEVLKRSGAPLSISEDQRGDPARVRKRGNSSILLNNAPLLVVDEVRMVDLRYLREIPAVTIDRMEVVNGTRGTARYGTGSGNGVIVVSTRAPR